MSLWNSRNNTLSLGSRRLLTSVKETISRCGIANQGGYYRPIAIPARHWNNEMSVIESYIKCYVVVHWLWEIPIPIVFFIRKWIDAVPFTPHTECFKHLRILRTYYSKVQQQQHQIYIQNTYI